MGETSSSGGSSSSSSGSSGSSSSRISRSNSVEKEKKVIDFGAVIKEESVEESKSLNTENTPSASIDSSATNSRPSTIKYQKDSTNPKLASIKEHSRDVE